jgi:hypothetical protein
MTEGRKRLFIAPKTVGIPGKKIMKGLPEVDMARPGIQVAQSPA